MVVAEATSQAIWLWKILKDMREKQIWRFNSS